MSDRYVGGVLTVQLGGGSDGGNLFAQQCYLGGGIVESGLKGQSGSGIQWRSFRPKGWKVLGTSWTRGPTYVRKSGE